MHTPEEKQRQKTLHYFLNGKQVCKNVFMKTLSITRSRIAYLFNTKNKHSIVSPDKRGKSIPVNKTNEETISRITKFLNDIPKFTSHYSSSERLYFHPTLTWKKIFEQYCLENPNHCVSFYIFKREIEKYNVKIYLPKKDTCSQCDQNNAKLKGELSEEERRNVIASSEMHKKRAEYARKILKEKELESRSPNSKLLCLTFDLEKTQPIPYLNTSVVFYKRQMWFYNLGINTRHDNKAYMCVWQETDGKRGSNEVASSLNEFLKTIDLSKYDHIHSFSDGCGGQNRNKTMVAFFMHICQTTHIETWTHSFLESGHSFLPNDTDFGKIEKAKNKNLNIFTANEWKDIIKQCNFNVIEMKGKFLEFSDLQKYHTYRKANADDEKFMWSHLKWMRVSKTDKSILEYKTTNDPVANTKKIDFSKRGSQTINRSFQLKCLYQDPIKLSLEKFKDIQSLLPYVPQIHLPYFQNLPHATKAKKTNAEPYPDESDD